jgi:hypothetical protein
MPVTINVPAMLAFRRAAVLVAILAMMVRGLIPAGWMPNPDGMGRTAFILCDMDDLGLTAADLSHTSMAHMAGMDMSHMDMSKGGAHKHADDGHQQPCPFSAAPHVATPSAPAMLSLPSLAVQFAHPLRQPRLAAGVASYTPQSPRAPPHLA